MKTLLNTLKDRLAAKEPTVLVTVVASSGSTPGEPARACWWGMRGGFWAPSAAAP